MFGDAAGEINFSRQCKLRAPEQEADEKDVQRVRSVTIEKILAFSEKLRHEQHSFIELRDAVCSRLTMFNARRGGEPCRLTRQHWAGA